MAGFHTKTFQKHDDYMTPKYAWENIAHFLPKDKVIWEPFYFDGKSGVHLRELGFQVIHENVDFFENDFGDIIVSNPPFSEIPRVLKRLKELKKPFVLLMPMQKWGTNYMKEYKDKMQLVIPWERINFRSEDETKTGACPFDCLYYFYDMGLPTNAILLKPN